MAYLRLKELAEAKDKNLTISQVQRSTGLTIGLVRRYWYNQTSSVTLEALEKLAAFLGVQENELIGSGPKPPMPPVSGRAGRERSKR